MADKERNTSVNARTGTIPTDAERTLQTPRFDNSSIQRAQPAVPLSGGRRAKLRDRSWPLSIVTIAVVAALAGGVLGGIVLSRYRQDETTARTAQSSTMDASDREESIDAEAAPVETAEEVANGAGESETVASSSRGIATPPAPANERPALVDEAAEDEGATGEGEGDGATGEDVEAALRGALGSWIAATNSRDIGKQMEHYNSTMRAFYLTRDVPREAVRREKSRVFSGANVVDVRASEPSIRVERDGRSAVMRFRKRYNIEGGGHDRKGEVLQELRWRRTKKGWKITSERDLRVID